MTEPTFPADYFYWHRRLLTELQTLADDYGSSGYNSRGLAGNVGYGAMDTLRYLRELESWGMVEPCEPLWDYSGPGIGWYSITAKGRDLVAPWSSASR